MSFLGDAVEGLQAQIVRFQRIDLWPLEDAARAILEAVEAVYEIVAEPSVPALEDLEDAAAAWHRMGVSWTQAGQDVDTTGARSAAADVVDRPGR